VTRASAIIRRAKKRKALRPTWTQEQEYRYKVLVAQLEAKGFLVRREELKRGHCWKVVSGSCRSLSQNLVFVDSRLAPNDQISFLEGTIAEVEDSVAQAA
jgi:hypothetical protein